MPIRPGNPWPAVALAVLALAATVGGTPAAHWLRLERAGIAAGEWWRLLSGHLVHLEWLHLWLNLLGLALVAWLVGDAYRPARWLVVGLGTALVVSGGLLVLNPELQWYVGLSGVLHGLLAAGAVVALARGEAHGWFLTGLLAGKLAWESWGPSAGGTWLLSTRVVQDAHLYGAVGGWLSAALLGLLRGATRGAGGRPH